MKVKGALQNICGPKPLQASYKATCKLHSKYTNVKLQGDVIQKKGSNVRALVNFGQLGPNSMLQCSYDDGHIFVGFLLRRGARLV